MPGTKRIVEIKEEETCCADGCCVDYRYHLYVDGEKVGTFWSEQEAVTYFVTDVLGHKVEYTFEE